MEILTPMLVGALVAVGLYLMMRRQALSLLVGLVILAHAVNLLLFSTGGFVRGRPPVLAGDQAPAAQTMADPLPQALILTAIVIGLGVQAFFLVLLYRLIEGRSADLNDIRQTDRAGGGGRR